MFLKCIFDEYVSMISSKVSLQRADPDSLSQRSWLTTGIEHGCYLSLLRYVKLLKVWLPNHFHPRLYACLKGHSFNQILKLTFCVYFPPRTEGTLPAFEAPGRQLCPEKLTRKQSENSDKTLGTQLIVSCNQVSLRVIEYIDSLWWVSFQMMFNLQRVVMNGAPI